jgi:hypothetical protein
MKYIYEFDLAKCFNTIRLEGQDKGLDYINKDSRFIEKLSLGSILEKLNVPKYIIQQLINFNKNTPKLMENETIDKEDPELWEVLNDTESQLKLLRKRGMYHASYRPDGLMKNDSYGFTQGSPLSPILTILCLEH